MEEAKMEVFDHKLIIKELAKGQRALLLGVLADIVLAILWWVVPSLFLLLGFAELVVTIVMILNSWRVAKALGWSTVGGIIACVLLFFPCLSLITLLVLICKATKELRQYGLRVGLLGVSSDDINRL